MSSSRVLQQASRSLQRLRPLSQPQSSLLLQTRAASTTTTSTTARATTPTRSYTARPKPETPAAKAAPATTVITPARTAASTTSKSTTTTNYKSATPTKTNLNTGVIDPQAAIPAATTVADVDPDLAAEMEGGSTPPSASFTQALRESSRVNNGSYMGPGAGTVETIDWSSSFHGLGTMPFDPEIAKVLMAPIDPMDIEIKPDGIIYLPEIKYRRILNNAFGPGGWGLAPRGELVVGEKVVTREYALVVHGRFIAQARGECQYFSEETIPTAGEGCKSNALLRCCKDLGIASELWDPRFIREFKKQYCHEIWVEHVVTKKRRQIWCRKDGEPAYPFQAVKPMGR